MNDGIERDQNGIKNFNSLNGNLRLGKGALITTSLCSPMLSIQYFDLNFIKAYILFTNIFIYILWC